MAVKEVAKQVIDALPDGVSMDDIIDALYVRAKFDRGEKEIHEGKGIPHEEAKKRLEKWQR
jgi:predicted transcriptional regulator